MLLNKQRCLWVAATVVTAALIALAVGGCGSGGSSGPASLTKAEFVAQANAICRTAGEGRKQETEGLGKGEEGTDPSTEADAGMEALVAPVNTMTGELAALGAPKGEAPQVKAIIASFEGGWRDSKPAPPRLGPHPLLPRPTSWRVNTGWPTARSEP